MCLYHFCQVQVADRVTAVQDDTVRPKPLVRDQPFYQGQGAERFAIENNALTQGLSVAHKVADCAVCLVRVHENRLDAKGFEVI